MKLLSKILLILALAALPSLAADAPLRLYEPASPHWTLSLQTPLAVHMDPASPLAGLAALDEAGRAASLAPVVFELQNSLHLSPEQFAKLDPADQSAALSLASDQARENLTQKTFELVGEAKTLVWSGGAMNRDQLVQLHSLATRLQEIKRHYGGFLTDDERESVAATSAQASSRYLEARAIYLGIAGKATADALGQLGQRAPPDGVAAARTTAAAFSPSPKARKLLDRMKDTKSGWGEKDLETVYLGYGFTYRDGAKHRMYTHPLFPQLHTTVSRQRDLPPGYAVDAVKLIAEAEALRAPTALPSSAIAAADDAELPVPPPAPVKAVKTPKAPAPKIEVSAAELAPLAQVSAVAVETRPAPKPAAKPEPVPAAVAAPVIETAPAPETTADNGWVSRLKRLLGR